jgi:hypothetical protein
MPSANVREFQRVYLQRDLSSNEQLEAMNVGIISTVVPSPFPFMVAERLGRLYFTRFSGK